MLLTPLIKLAEYLGTELFVHLLVQNLVSSN